MKKVITEKVKNKIIEMYNNGLSSVKISEKLKINASTIISFLKKSGITIRSNKENSRKYSYDFNHFENIDTEEKAYWLGFLYADGYVSNAAGQKIIGLSISSCDKGHLEKFNLEINSNYKINEYVSTTGYSNNSKYCRLAITGEKMYNDLVNHGVVEHKTNILKPPNIDKNLIRHFIRGYFDGDGCITSSVDKSGYKKYSIKILGTFDIVNFIKVFVEENDIAKINKFYKRKSEQDVLSIEFGGNRQVKKFLDLIYSNSTIYLERKYVRYNDLCNLLHGRVIEKSIA